MPSKAPVWALLGAAAIAAACSDSAGISPSTVSGTTTLLFTGSVPVRGSRSYTFGLSRPGTAELTLAGVSLDSRGSALTTPMGLGLGTPSGDDCDMTTSVTTPPGLTAQLRTATGPGTFCVRVFDAGSLTTPVNATVRVIQPSTAPSSMPASPTSETFASVLADRGFTSHAFAAESGTISVTLTSVGPPSVPIGLGVGVAGGTAGCTLSTSLTTEGGSAPQISVSVDKGSYCVQVYDVGTLTGPTRFSMTISRP